MSLPLTAGKWTVDQSHSSIAFVAKHLGFTKVRGTFNEYTLDVNVAETLEASSVESVIQLMSVNTGSVDRDTHLQSADFFGASQDPTMKFVSTSISGKEDDFKITGDLTINGKTLPVTFDAEFEGTIADPYGKVKAGFEAKSEINRTDFGIDWNVPVGGGLLVSENIKIILDIQLTPAAQ